MKNSKLKTKETTADAENFLKTIKNEQKQKDSFAVLELMKKATKSQPKMWGSSIIGFGNTVLKYENGRELDWFIMGFSPRKQALTLYGLMSASDLLKKLGKYKTSKGCLYINKLEEIDTKVLKQIIEKVAKNKKLSEKIK